MKLVKGRTLSELLDEAGAGSDLRWFLSIFEAICQTVGLRPRTGGDPPRPQACQCDGRLFGEVQVMDWGLAKVLA